MIKIILIGIIIALLGEQLKMYKSSYQVHLSLIGCLIIFYLGFSKLQIVIDAINKIESYIPVNKAYIGIIIKILGISVICEFAANICRECGQASVSSQIELVGKLTILAMGMPIIMALLDTINNFLT